MDWSFANGDSDLRYWMHLFESFYQIKMPDTLLEGVYTHQHLRDVTTSLKYGLELRKRGFRSEILDAPVRIVLSDQDAGHLAGGSLHTSASARCHHVAEVWIGASQTGIPI